MNLRRAVSGCAAFLLLTTMGVGAATSDVADAVMRGDSAAVRRLLTQKADVNAPQADGATALHWAVYRDDVATVDLLLKAGANPKAANGFGATPLSLAAENGNPAIVQRLLDAGADANERMPNSDTVLMMAARTGNVATMKLLLDRGADVNAKETTRGTTALMWAAAQRHPAAVQLLVDRGADVNAVSTPAWQDRPVRYAKAVDPRPSQGRNQDRVVSQVGPRNTRDHGRRGAHSAGVRGARQRSGIGAHSARGRRRREPGDELRLEPAARRDAESVLPARILSARPWCQSEPRQQGRLVAPVHRGRQPQHRRWGLSASQGGHGSPGVHQEADRQGRRRQLASPGVDVVSNGVHVAVGARGRRDRLLARVPVQRSRRDEAAARTRRRSEHCHHHRCHPAAGRGRHRLGGRRHLRMVEGSQRRSGEAAAEALATTRTRRPRPDERRCTARHTRGPRRSFRCWWTPAPNSTSEITAERQRRGRAAEHFTGTCRSTTPTA